MRFHVSQYGSGLLWFLSTESPKYFFLHPSRLVKAKTDVFFTNFQALWRVVVAVMLNVTKVGGGGGSNCLTIIISSIFTVNATRRQKMWDKCCLPAFQARRMRARIECHLAGRPHWVQISTADQMSGGWHQMPREAVTRCRESQHVLWTWGARGRFGRSTLIAASLPATQACSGGAGDSTHSMWLLVKMRPVQSAVTDLEHVTNPVCHEPHLPVRQLATEGENRGTSGGEERKKMSFALLNYL